MVECANLFFLIYYDSLHFDSKKNFIQNLACVYSQVGVVVVRCSTFKTSVSCPLLCVAKFNVNIENAFERYSVKNK